MCDQPFPPTLVLIESFRTYLYGGHLAAAMLQARWAVRGWMPPTAGGGAVIMTSWV